MRQSTLESKQDEAPGTNRESLVKSGAFNDLMVQQPIQAEQQPIQPDQQPIEVGFQHEQDNSYLDKTGNVTADGEMSFAQNNDRIQANDIENQ